MLVCLSVCLSVTFHGKVATPFSISRSLIMIMSRTRVADTCSSMTKLAREICSISSERAPNEIKHSTAAHSFSDRGGIKNKNLRMESRKGPRAVQALEDVTLHFSPLTRARLLVARLCLPRCSYA